MHTFLRKNHQKYIQKEIRCISTSVSAMGRLNRHLYRKPNMSRSTKLRIFNVLVGYVMLYGAETWHASIAELKAIDVFQTKSLRRI